MIVNNKCIKAKEVDDNHSKKFDWKAFISFNRLRKIRRHFIEFIILSQVNQLIYYYVYIRLIKKTL